MNSFVRRLGPAIIIGLLVALVVAVGAILALNPRLTAYVESDAFRAEMERETAKGLHFPEGHYEPIKRSGFLSGATDGFTARNGGKALRSLEAHGIRAKFNPWGVFLRRWQLDEVHVDGGEVGIQVYEPKPEPSPAKPWYHVFLPQRVYLKRVESDPVDVTWRFRGARAGFFGTRLLITPHGRDFNYEAKGGTLKMPLLPDLTLRETHLLITRTLLSLYNLDLESGSSGHLHAEGTAGTRDDKRVDFKITLDRLPIAEWLPVSWNEHVSGRASGKVAWRGQNPKLENSEGEAHLRVDDGRVVRLAFLEKLAGLTGEKALERLTLRECSAEITWRYPKVEIRRLAIEDEKKFRAEGAVTIENKHLDGTIDLGLAPPLLNWLPAAEKIFPREHDGYRWTTVHLSGTLDAPQQDLSPRIMEAIKSDPGQALKLFLRQFGEWLEGTFGG
jgi:hypothetical protein